VNVNADEIHRKARMLCYGSTERADEVLQELYPRLVAVLRRNPQGFDNAWAVIHRVAARLAIDSYRKYRRSLRTKQLLDPGELCDSGRPPPDMPDTETLHSAIASLPERLQVIVLGIFIEGCKAKDVARRVGLSESRVAELKGTALAHLRKVLTNPEELQQGGRR
jgi:RNA polymerase sigma factor (sigma-70 family)